MAIIGVQFDKMRVTPALDGATNVGLYGPYAYKVWGNVETRDGMNIVIPSSAFIIGGRLINISGNNPVAIPSNFSGSVVLTVDLTKSNHATGNPVYDNYSVTNNQVYLRAIKTENIRHENIDGGGKVYDLELCKVVSNGTSLTKVSHTDTIIMNIPTPLQYWTMNIKNDRIYAKQAAFDVTAANKYRQLGVLLERHGRLVFAKVNMKTVTTLAWEQILDIGNFPGYRPDGGDYGGIFNEMSYNTEPGGLYIAGTTLRIQHVGRTDVRECSYSGVVSYLTNDDFPNNADIVAGWKRS